MSDVVDELLNFLAEATTPFHAVSAMEWRLAAAGFTELDAIDGEKLEPGQGYFYTRNGSSIIAFRAGTNPPEQGLRLIGAHTDSPNLSVKPNPIKVRHGVVQIAVDVYGGALLNPWFDRDLSLAGRVNFVDSEEPLPSASRSTGRISLCGLTLLPLLASRSRCIAKLGMIATGFWKSIS